jgi:hypothetical protein
MKHWQTQTITNRTQQNKSLTNRAAFSWQKVRRLTAMVSGQVSFKMEVKWNLKRTGFPERFGRNEITHTHRRNIEAHSQIAQRCGLDEEEA